MTASVQAAEPEFTGATKEARCVTLRAVLPSVGTSRSDEYIVQIVTQCADWAHQVTT